MNQTDPTTIEPMAMTVDDCVRATRIGRTRLYELIRAGEIEAVKSGSRTLVLASSCRRYLEGLPRVGAKSAA